MVVLHLALTPYASDSPTRVIATLRAPGGTSGVHDLHVGIIAFLRGDERAWFVVWFWVR